MRQRSRKKRSSRLKVFRLVLLIGLLFTMVLIFLVSTIGSKKFGPFHKLALESIGPVQRVFSETSRYVYKIKTDYLDLISVRDENEKLWKELQECRNSSYQYREALASNARLQKLLDFKNNSDLPVIAASIAGKDPSLWFRTLTIDRGTSDGVKNGMPVVTDGGIVGQVFNIAPNYSRVLLAIAPSSAIDVVLQKSRVRGILKGTGSLKYRLDYILKTVEVEKGDHVVTAGYGGTFPSGLPVGVISRVVRKKRGMFQEIEVTPSVDYLTLEELLVIQREIPFKE